MDLVTCRIRGENTVGFLLCVPPELLKSVVFLYHDSVVRAAAQLAALR